MPMRPSRGHGGAAAVPPYRDRGRLCPPYDAPNVSLLRGRLDRVLHVVVGGELDVVELAVLLLDLADIDVLDDVARLRIDRHRAARALPLEALHGRDQLV